MPRKHLSWDDHMASELKDPEYARMYLDTALDEYQKDHELPMLLIAMRHLTDAQGGVAQLAQRTGLNRENLFRVLSGKSNPRWDTVVAILGGLGYQFTLKPLAKPTVAEGALAAVH